MNFIVKLKATLLILFLVSNALVGFTQRLSVFDLSIDSIKIDTHAIGLQNVKALVRNNGDSIVTKFAITWTVSLIGSSSSTTQTATYTKTLDKTGLDSAWIDIGSYDFDAIGSYEVSAEVDTITGVLSGPYLNGNTTKNSISNTVIVNEIINQGSTASICSPTTTTITLSATNNRGNTYQWANLDSIAWQNVGNAGFSDSGSIYHSLAFYNGEPYVAYYDSGNGGATVMKYNGTSWVLVGNAGFSDSISNHNSLAFYDGEPYVAYKDYGNGGKTTVMKYNGTSWVSVGSKGFSLGPSEYQSLAFYNGEPYVAYKDTYHAHRAVVMKYNRTSLSWEYVGNAGGFSGQSANWISLAFSNGVPYVAYKDDDNRSATTVMKYNVTSWEYVGNAGFSSNNASYQSLAIYNGVPYVAYRDQGNGDKTTVMKYDGGWILVGNAGFSAGTTFNQSLAIYNGVPYVAYEDQGNGGRTTVMKYNGTSWVNVGNAGFSAGGTNFQSLVFYDGEPYVAYRDNANRDKATVMRYGPKIVGNSHTYVATTAGRYQLKITTASGSAIYDTIVVAADNNYAFTDVQTACDSLKWIDGLTYFSNNTTATHTLTSAGGCDSVITLNLTVFPSSTIQLQLVKDSSCAYGDSILLEPSSALPIGGVYTGSNVNSNTRKFGPTVSGTYPITYTYIDTNQCKYVNFSIKVNPNPTVSLNTLPDLCINNSPVTINQGTYNQGNFEYKSTKLGRLINSIYDPKKAGIGSDTITYSYENIHNCRDSINQVILVLDTTVLSFNLPLSQREVCENTPVFNIAYGTPSGGIYTSINGNGVTTGNSFNPSLADTGLNRIEYSYIDNNSCKSIIQDTISVYALTNVTHTPDTFCINEGPRVLRGGTFNTSYKYSGDGMVNDSVFSPLAAKIGSESITYSYTNSRGCVSQSTAIYLVNDLPNVQFTTPSPVCINSDTFFISGTSTSGNQSYFFNSIGFIDTLIGQFLPNRVAVGTELIGFVGKNTLTGCSDTLYENLIIDSVPNTTFNPMSDLCKNDSGIVLTQGSPIVGGIGVYSGVGVIGTNFHPSNAPSGRHILTYTFTNQNNCSASDTEIIVVHPIPQLTPLLLSPLCLDDNPITLVGAQPSGGYYTGLNVDSLTSILTPDSVGVWPVEYHYTDSNGCVNSISENQTVRDLPNTQLNFSDQLCKNIDSVLLQGGSPVGGTYISNSIVGNYYYPNQNQSPIDTLIYDYTDSFSCRNLDTVIISIEDTFPIVFNTVLNYCENAGEKILDDANGFSSNFNSYYTSTKNSISGNNRYNPDQAGVGKDTLVYNVTNPISNCSSEAKRIITVDSVPLVTLTDTSFCLQNLTIQLEGGFPLGGNYISARGIIDTTGGYLITQAGAGLDTLKYFYEYSTNGCKDTATSVYQIYESPVVSFVIPQKSRLSCENSESFTLTGQSPVSLLGTSTFLGKGVDTSGTKFDSKLAGEGVHIIKFEYTDVNLCTDSAFDTIIVKPIPVLSFDNEIDSICENANPINLSATPSGGTFSGVGVLSNNTFDPSLVGANLESKVTYTYTDKYNCTNTIIDTFDIDSVSSIGFGLIADICINNSPVTINQGTYNQGNFEYKSTKLGRLINSIYDPKNAGIGSDTITYSYENIHNCRDSINQVILVVDTTVLSFNLPLSQRDVCENTPVFNITSGTPSGGIYTSINGNGVTTGNSFNPSLADTGLNRIEYSYIDNNSCKSIIQDTISVYTLTNVTHTPDTFCINESPRVLRGGTFNTSYKYSGDGMVNDSVFSPLAAKIGSESITYSYTNSRGCVSQSTAIYLVNDLPNVQFTTPSPVCINSDTFFISGTSTSGNQSYFFNSIGFIDTLIGQFLPNRVAVGTELIGFVGKDTLTGCSDTLYENLIIDSVPNTTFNPMSDLCKNDSGIVLTQGSPIVGGIGVYSGVGVIGTNFHPSNAPSGRHILTYTFTNQNNCSASDTEIIVVHPIPQLTPLLLSPLCLDDNPITLVGAQPLGGYYTGLNVDSLTSILTPDSVGVWPVEYHYTDNNGCVNSISQNQTVRDLPNTQLNFSDQLCKTIDSVLLQGGSPVGGTYISNSIVGNYYYPNQNQSLIDTLIYDYTDSFSCRNLDTVIISIEDTFPIVFNTVLNYCENAGEKILDDANGFSSNFNSYYTSTKNSISGNNRYNPDQAGVGKDTLVYNVTNPISNCSSEAKRIITVDSVPLVTLTDTSFCLQNLTIQLEGGFPLGGNYISARGIIDTTGGYLITQAGAGLDTLKYFYEYSTNGCKDTATSVYQIYESPVVSFVIPQKSRLSCENSESFTLTGQSPVSLLGTSTFLGKGVDASGTKFDSKLAGEGVHIIKFEYTDVNLCTDSAFDTIIVKPIPVLSFDNEIDSICEKANPINLSAKPPGGTFSGVGVLSNNTFDPSLVGANLESKVTYTYTDEYNCTNTIIDTFDIDSVSSIGFGLIADICINNSPVTINQGTYNQGNFEYKSTKLGRLINSIYDPKKAGIGSDTITYSYENIHNCRDSINQVILVVDTTVLSFNLPLSQREVCENTPVFNITSGTPSGGIYTSINGNGVTTGNSFNPSLADTGLNRIEYSYIDNNSCKSIIQDTISVYTLTNVTHTPDTFCINESPRVLRGGTFNTSYKYSGDGMVNDSVFSPLAANIGSESITYSYTNSRGCVYQSTAIYLVNDIPNVQFTTPSPVCINSDTFFISGTSTSGNQSYFFNSIGFIDTLIGQFLPNRVAVGTELIGFVGKNTLTGCSDTLYENLIIDSVPNTTFNPMSDLCKNDSGIVLTQGSPIVGGIGVYSGVGVIGTNFHPLIAPSGRHILTYTFTDQNNCSASDTEIIVVHPIPQLTPLLLSPLCLDDNPITLVGAQPLGGYYTGLNVDSLTSILTPDSVGVWPVEYHYTDNNGCVNSISQNQTVRDLPNTQLNFSDQLCKNIDSVLLQGGSPVGGTYISNSIVGNYYYPNQNQSPIDTLIYDYTDLFSCRNLDTVIISIEDTVQLFGKENPLLCKSEITLDLSTICTPTGGSYSGNGIFNNTLFTNFLDTGTNLFTYSFLNANNCVSRYKGEVTIKPIPELKVTPDTGICFGERINLIATSNAPFEWYDGSFKSVVSVKPNQSRTYSVQSINQFDCIAEKTISVKVFAPIEVSSTSIDATCENADGVAIVTATGGVKPYTYTWPSGQHSSRALSNLFAGNYQVTVTDNVGCAKGTTASVNSTDGPQINLVSKKDITCFGDNSGEIEVEIISEDPYTLLWNSGSDSAKISNLSKGLYELSVLSSRGCNSFKTFEITSPNSYNYNVITKYPGCDSTNGQISIVLKSSKDTINYSWLGQPSGDTLFSIPSGNYAAIATNKQGCTDTIHVNLSNNKFTDLKVDSIKSPDCKASNGYISVSGLDTIKSFEWSNGQTTQLISNLAVGSYILTVTDTSGCKTIAEYNLSKLLPPSPTICVVTNDSILGKNIITWDTTGLNVDSFIVYRESSTINQYFKVGAISKKQSPVFEDKWLLNNTSIGNYALTTKDACGTESEYSKTHKSILLNTSQAEDSIIQLNWSSYLGYDYNDFFIYRYSTQFGIELLDSLTNVNLYVDDKVPDNSERIYYFIAIKGQSDCNNLGVASISNLSNNYGTFNIGLSELNDDDLFLVWPNPSNGMLNIQLKGVDKEDGIIMIFNSLGKVLYEENYSSSDLNFTQIINLKDTPTGLYYIQFIQKEKILTKEIIIYR